MSLRTLALAALAPLLPLAFVACDGAAAPPAVPPVPSASAVPAAPSAAPAASSAAPAAANDAVPATWKEAKTHEQQMAYMKAKVLPAAQKAWEGSKNPEVTCKTCHGPKYVEPKAFLPKLTMKDGKITAFAEKPEIAKAMATKVVPTVAEAMGEKPYDPATHQGFGCAGCHTIEMK